MKRITVTLTEDQWREVSNLLMQRQASDTDESMAFRWRLVKAIHNALSLPVKPAKDYNRTDRHIDV